MDDFKIYEMDVSLGKENIENSVLKKERCIYIAKSDCDFAYIPESLTDTSEFKNNNIPTYSFFYDSVEGGVIINSPEDLSCIIFVPMSEIENLVELNKHVVEYISKYYPDTKQIGNDILVNDKKIAGLCGGFLNGLPFNTYMFSFKDNTELINLLCNKKSSKEPGYLDENIIHREDLKNEIITWLQSH